MSDRRHGSANGAGSGRKRVLRALCAFTLGFPLLGTEAPSADRAESAAGTPGPYDRYLPFRLGDSWTYDWHTEGRREPTHTVARTRVFEGTEFIGGSFGYKLVGDDGSYYVYTLRNGVLSLHASSEAGRILYYEPPIPLATPTLQPGQPLVTVNPDTQRKWKTTLLGTEDVTVPLGTFKGCLKIRLEMESPEFVSDSYHYFAPNVGLVAYQYTLLSADRKTTEAKVDARLKLARLAGIPISKMEDVARLEGAGTVRLAGADDPNARAILKRAIESRYTWDEKFPGFRGDFEYVEEGKLPVRGSFSVDKDLNVKVTAPTEAAKVQLASQISSFLSHRRYHPFDIDYAGASFRKGTTGPGGETEILAEGDTMGTSYIVRKGEILRVARSAGRVRFVADNLSQLRIEDGRYIAVEYELTYFSNEDQRQISKDTLVDAYSKVGSYWLPVGRKSVRTERGQKAAAFDLRLTNLH